MAKLAGVLMRLPACSHFPTLIHQGFQVSPRVTWLLQCGNRAVQEGAEFIGPSEKFLTIVLKDSHP